MDLEHFIALSIIPILSPGPSTYVLTHNTYCYGFKRTALYLVADELGTLLTALLTLIVLRVLLQQHPGALPAVQVVGSIYAMLLGALCLRKNYSVNHRVISPVMGSPSLTTFLVGLSNPKTVIFFTLLSDSLIFSPVQHAVVYAIQKYSCLFFFSLALTVAREHVFRQRRLAINVAASALFGFGTYAFSNVVFIP